MKSDDPQIEKHWNHADPAAQPALDMVMGVSQLVLQEKTRLGDGATAAQVVAGLKERGINLDEAAVAKCLTAGEC